MDKLIVYSNNVKQALLKKLPIVALESTIINHGMQYPDNYETACALENIIIKQGCIPATICIIEGKIHIGLDEELLHFVAKSSEFMKISTNNLSYVLSNKLNGSTTVATTT